MNTVPLHALAHARTGDKGNRSSISVIAYDPADWSLLVAQVTEARDDVLDGGVNGSLNLDTHGKTLSSFLLTLPITRSIPQET
jgi:hypothetical protein